MVKTEGRADAGRLRRSSTVASVGEGIAATALPILAVGVTEDPLSVATVIAVQHLPWSVVALAGPTLLRRLDRRTLVGAVNTGRAVVMGLVAMRAASGTESLVLLLVAALVIGLGEALHDDAGQAGGAERAAHLPGMIGLAVVGMPLGGFLYELVAVVPFVAGVLVFAVAALLALLLRRPLLPSRSSLSADGDAHRARRPAPVVTAVAALAAAGTSAVLGVLVLFALQDLGLGAPAFGLLLAGLCAAAAVGAIATPTVARLLGVRRGLQVALLAVAAGHLVAAVAADPRWPVVSALGLGIGTGAAMVGGLLTRALLQSGGGQAARTFSVVVWAALPMGAMAGGLVARFSTVAVAVGASGVLPLAGAALATMTGRRTISADEAPPVPPPPPPRPAERPKASRPPSRQQIPEIELTGAAPPWSDARVRTRRVER